MRPWYRIHFSTLFVLAIVLAGLVFINIPGERTGPYARISNRFYHGWPYHYFDRLGSEFTYWSFAGADKRFHTKALVLNLLAVSCIAALVACVCELWIRRNGRLLRFGTRWLLIAIALIAVPIGLVSRDVRRCAHQQQVFQELAQFGAVETTRDLQKFDWLRSLFGDHFHGTIRSAKLSATQPVDRLPDLRSLDSLQRLHLVMPNLPENMDQVAELTNLTGFSVTLTSLDETDRSRLTELTQLPQLDSLQLLVDDIDDGDVLLISAESRVLGLAVSSPRITEKSLHRLSRLKSLTHLTLHAKVILDQDQNIAVFSRFSKLTSMHLLGHGLTAKDADKVRVLWPDASFFGGTPNAFWEILFQRQRE
jgi:hypothetical protein